MLIPFLDLDGPIIIRIAIESRETVARHLILEVDI